MRSLGLNAKDSSFYHCWAKRKKLNFSGFMKVNNSFFYYFIIFTKIKYLKTSFGRSFPGSEGWPVDCYAKKRIFKYFLSLSSLKFIRTSPKE